jgi:hypothetical protein
MKGIAVKDRIQLLDVDQPGEIFEAHIEDATPPLSAFVFQPGNTLLQS